MSSFLSTSDGVGNNDLLLYLRTLNIFGIICAHWNAAEQRLYATNLDKLRALAHFLVIELIMLMLFSYTYLYPEHFYSLYYNHTGNVDFIFGCRSCCLAMCLVHALAYWQRKRHFDFLAKILQIYYNNKNAEVLRFRRNFIFYLLMFVLFILNYIYDSFNSNLSTYNSFTYIFIFAYAYLIVGILILFCVCFKQIIAAALRQQNLEIRQQILNKTKRLQLYKNLDKRQHLLYFCLFEFNNCFSLLLLPTIGLILFITPSGPFYLITIVFETEYDSYYEFAIECVLSIFWNVPWLIMVLLLFWSDAIEIEANKTAKILSKIPRTGSGLDRMVEKFLLKNLRKQPILTAYGFFSLDKSTLFKLFTAIFTYMVILVQFKEMENSTKQIQTTKPITINDKPVGYNHAFCT